MSEIGQVGNVNQTKGSKVVVDYKGFNREFGGHATVEYKQQVENLANPLTAAFGDVAVPELVCPEGSRHLAWLKWLYFDNTVVKTISEPELVGNKIQTHQKRVVSAASVDTSQLAWNESYKKFTQIDNDHFLKENDIAYFHDEEGLIWPSDEFAGLPIYTEVTRGSDLVITPESGDVSIVAKQEQPGRFVITRSKLDTSGLFPSGGWTVSTETVGGEDVLVAYRAFYTWEDFPWPAVLSGVTANYVNRKSNSGNYLEKIDFVANLSRQPYRGRTKFLVEQYWRQASWDDDLSDVLSMQPRSIYWNTPWGSLSVDPCLHEELYDPLLGPGNPLYVTNGTTDSARPYHISYMPANEALATNYTDWPETIVTEDKQTPFRSGFLRTKMTAERPDL